MSNVRKGGKSCWTARINKFGKEKHLGSFPTQESAFEAYKQAKESYVKEVAEKWKGKIDDKAYQALLQWKIEITD